MAKDFDLAVAQFRVKVAAERAKIERVFGLPRLAIPAPRPPESRPPGAPPPELGQQQCLARIQLFLGAMPVAAEAVQQGRKLMDLRLIPFAPAGAALVLSCPPEILEPGTPEFQE